MPVSERSVQATTILLRRMRAGDSAASAEFLAHVLGELKELARSKLARERAGHTLQPTALINEAWLRLGAGTSLDVHDRAEFLGIAAHAMREVLVDHARSKRAGKRGGGRKRVTLDVSSMEMAPADSSLDVLDLHEALEKLSDEDAELARIVELRYFGGLTLEETSQLLGKSLSQVHRAWLVARGWLHRRLAGI